MRPRVLLGEALRNIAATKQRSLLALLGIVIGTASVIAMLNVGTIMQNAMLEQFRAMGTNVVNIRERFQREEDGQAVSLTPELAFDLGRETDGLQRVAPFSTGSAQLQMGAGNHNLRLTGATESLRDLLRVRLAQGRWISDIDGVSLQGVFGAEVAQRYAREAGSPLEVGERVRIGAYYVTVAGILEPYPRGGGVSPVSPNSTVFLPLEALQRFEPDGDLDGILARVHNEVDHSALGQQIIDWFSDRVPGLRVEVNSAEQLLENMEAQSRMFTVMLGAIGSIALIVGGVGIMNIMLVSVTERRREIGIRLAIGARNADIRRQFLVEAVLLCLLGGLLGAVLGTGVAYGFAHFTGNAFVAAPVAVALGVSVSTLTGVAFGYYPALQASRLDPIIALRSE